MSMKNSNDTTGNQTRDLPACSAVPHPTAPPRATFMSGRRLVRRWVNTPGWLDASPRNETRLVGSLEISLTELFPRSPVVTTYDENRHECTAESLLRV